MANVFRTVKCVGLLVLAAGLMPAGLANPVPASDQAMIEKGEYLTNLLGCGGCHTEGALLGNAYGSWLAGSKIGVAYTDPTEKGGPGIVFPGNLTPDTATGIGGWTQADIARVFRRGEDHAGNRLNSVMPWANYNLLSDEDLSAIAAFLLSMEPVRHRIPENVNPGERVKERYLRIGVYVFDPDGTAASKPAPPD